MRHFALLFAAWLMSIAVARADQLPTGWATARALGMGNAYTSMVDDADAIFYNPAGLSRVSGVHWTILDVHAGLDNPQNAQNIKALASSSDFADQVNQLFGQNFWAGGGGKTAVVIPGIGLAGYVNTQGGALASNPPNPTAALDYYFDYGAAAGFAFDMIPNIFSLGITGRYVNRTGYKGTIGASLLAQPSSSQTQITSDLQSRGSAVAVDLGSEIRIPGPISPALSFVYRDVGTTTFSHDAGAGAPPSVPSEMIAGASVTLHAILLKVTPSIDYRYIGWSGMPLGENINAGVELSLPLIDLRGGVSQGYYTAGAGIDLGLIRADVATWAVELGAYPGQQVDRRYMAQITIGLGLDFGHLFGGSSGSGSGGSGGDSSSGSGLGHLFQRR